MTRAQASAGYNDELFQSPQAGNSGFSEEVHELSIALWYDLCKYCPDVMRRAFLSTVLMWHCRFPFLYMYHAG